MNAASLLNSRYRRLLAGSAFGAIVFSMAAQPAWAVQSDAPAEASAATTPATAEPAETPPADEATDDAAIIVTGSRLNRLGFTAPTPVTVVGAERAEQLGITSTSDLLAQVPAFRPSTSRSNSRVGSTPGASNADLRGFGPTRTLVLIDGRRVVASGSNGAVDLNLIPNSLVQRVEVVTGGASAAYGADAVAGVVNFILDTKLEGFKASVSSGITELGDDQRIQGSLAWGGSFAGDRGHIILGAEYERSKGTGDCYTRDYCSVNAASVANPNYGTNGLPGTIFGRGVSNARASTGGLIVLSPAGTTAAANALRGIAFAADGSLTTYTFGQFANLTNGNPSSGTLMIGGGEPNHLGSIAGIGMVNPVEFYSFFGHAGFDVTDSFRVYAEGSYGHVSSSDQLKFVNQANITIRRDNFYLPTALRNQMIAGGIQSFTLGRLNEDMIATVKNRTDTYRAVAGFDFDFADKWKLEGYYQYGQSKLRLDYLGNRVTTNFNNAVDAIANPANPSQPICRSTVTNPTNGCLPLNIFGVNQFTPEAYDYVTADGFSKNKFTQHVVSATISGSPFATWAGDVSIALGAEYRKSDTDIVADALSLANAFVQLNGKSTSGSIDVTEGFAEAAVPLAKDVPFLHSLEVNGAARYTHTKATQGATGGTFNATTWKVGAVWEPIPEIRARVTRSRDIRAPNATDLFSPPIAASVTVTDRTNNTQVTVPVFSGGNINARPEKADTFTAGVVLQPGGFLSGLQASIDYYDIKLNDALGQLAGQTVVDRCFAGDQSFCTLINRTGGVITSINAIATNFGTVKARGIDLDLSYRLPLPSLNSAGDAQLNFRILANHALDLVVTDAAGSTQGAGLNGQVTGQLATPKWTVDGTVSLKTGGLTFTVQERFISKGISRANFAVPGDPNYALTGNPLTIDYNTVPARFYTNLAAEYQIGGEDGKMTIYGTVSNLFNRNPPVTSTTRNATNPQYYDVLLRRYTVGARFRF